MCVHVYMYLCTRYVSVCACVYTRVCQCVLVPVYGYACVHVCACVCWMHVYLGEQMTLLSNPPPGTVKWLMC